jgi:uncharacterized protein YndB with AHSA1/START domain
MSDDRAVEVSVHIAAQPETVFRYFTDPGRYVQWMGAGAVLEPVPGGCYRIMMRDGVGSQVASSTQNCGSAIRTVTDTLGRQAHRFDRAAHRACGPITLSDWAWAPPTASAHISD